MRNTSAAGVTRRAGNSACTGAWVWLSLSLALPLCGAEVKLQVPDLPTEAGKSVAIDLPGLPSGAKKLALTLVPGRGSVQPFFMGKYEVTQGQYEAVMDAKAACSGTTSSVISTAISSRTPPFSS